MKQIISALSVLTLTLSAFAAAVHSTPFELKLDGPAAQAVYNELALFKKAAKTDSSVSVANVFCQQQLYALSDFSCFQDTDLDANVLPEATAILANIVNNVASHGRYGNEFMSTQDHVERDFRFSTLTCTTVTQDSQQSYSCLATAPKGL